MTPDESFQLTHANPATGSVSGGYHISLKGKGFQSGASVTIADIPANADFIDETELDVTVPSGVGSACGLIKVKVTNPDRRSVESTTVFRFVTSRLSFAGTPSYSLGGGLWASVAAGDWNGDGLNDIAVSQSGTGTFYHAAGDGKLGHTSEGRPSITGSYSKIAVVNLNNDSYQDLILYNPAMDYWAGLRGDQSFNFKLQDNMVKLERFRSVVELVNPGRASDLATLGKLGELKLWQNNGNTLTAIGVEPASLIDLQAVALGDFNGDSIRDLVSLGSSSAKLDVSPGLDFSKFGMPMSLGTVAMPRVVTVADLDGDKFLDLLVVSESPSSAARIYRALGGGVFVSQSVVPLESSLNTVVLQDLTCDGLPDLVTYVTNKNEITVYTNTSTPGSIAFAASTKVPLAAPATFESLAFANFNADNRVDIVALTTGGSVIFFGNESE